MYILRVLFGAYFLFGALIWLGAAAYVVQDVSHPIPVLKKVLVVSFAVSMAGIHGIAGWISLRERRSDGTAGRRWPLNASLANVLIFFGFAIVYCYLGGLDVFWQTERIFGIPQVAGLIGLWVFRRQRAPAK
jgi:hypothetical protein